LPSANNVIVEWTDLVLQAVAAHKQGTQVASRNMAILEAAIYDSVNAIDPTYDVYHTDATGFPGASTASPEAAAAQAAHDVAVFLYPDNTKSYDDTLAADLSDITDGQQAVDDGRALGQFVASDILTWRSTDGSTKSRSPPGGTEPGDWQPTPPNPPGTLPVTQQWGFITPFALESGSQFRPGPPPELTSADYTEAYQQVKDLGGNGTTTPSARTPEQTEIARYWAQAQGTSTPVGYWNHVAEIVAKDQGLTLAQDARLFALLNVTMADDAIATFDAKYTYNFWRPVTAIRAADTDGNPDTNPDPTWTPLITTPNHQSYVAFHASISESAAQALAAFFGTDHVEFTASSESLPGVGHERSYRKFTEAAHEAGMSRIYAGIHWSFDVAAGWHLGRNVGQYVAATFFQPALTSGAATLLFYSNRPGGSGGNDLDRTTRTKLHDKDDTTAAELLTPLLVSGADTSSRHGIDRHIAEFSDVTPGLAFGHILWLDANPAGWGWIDPTPGDDSESSLPGNQGWMDLLTVLEHELGHLLGREHEFDGLMAGTLTAGTRQKPGADAYFAELTAGFYPADVPSDVVTWFDPVHPRSRRT
ncbi:MAG TPA: phosphatase PAP2 family protein, partial [Gemmataceae bacterium]|nr:phosphatase PAP2 family protein [Gemmataceae bacterium]